MRSFRAAWIAAASLLSLSLLAVILRLAWVSDDAYITLRTVENWLAGHGPVWNVDERVQTYTHPLWLLLLTAGRAITGEHFFTTTFLSIGLSLLAALLVARLGRTLPAATAVLALLICSRAFGDFSTSGLETPLVFALLAAFATVVTGDGEPRHRLLGTATLTGLLATTRMDLALLAAPALLATVRGLPRPGAAVRIGLGLSPFLLWCAFATLYYGTPFPVTAYAKAIYVGIPAIDLLQQGLYYAYHLATTDPATAAVILAGTATGLFHPVLRCRALALGTLLYSAYVVKVGGDFMAGRFFAPPFVVALAILARLLGTLATRWSLLAIVGGGVLLFLPGRPPCLVAPKDDQPPTVGYHGIIDERSFYYWQQGLLSPTRKLPEPGGASAGLRAQGRTKQMVWTRGWIGRYAFEGGDLVHFVDPWLCDPLLMRLPTWNTVPGEWRIGHFIRHIPEGYLETIATGENRIVHPGLHRYYDALRTVIAAPVFDRGRLRVAWDLLRGAYQGDLDTYVRDDYHRSPRVRVAAAELADQCAIGSWWFDEPKTRVIYDGGIAVLFAPPVAARAVRLRLLGGIGYALSFWRGDTRLATVRVDTTGTNPVIGLQEYTADVPAEVGQFTSIWIDAPNPNSEHVACIGGLVLEN